MFAKLSITFTFASLALLAVATPNGKRWNTPTSAPSAPTKTVTVTAPASSPTGADSCSTGPIQCCESTESASSPAGAALLGILGVVVQGVDVALGLGCSPISVIGVGGSTCSANTVCCEDNSVGGLVSIGCVPVIL